MTTQLGIFSEYDSPVYGAGRPGDDYWRTPGWLIEAILPAAHNENGSILDAGAGDGRIARALELHHTRPLSRPTITAVEQCAERAAGYPDHWETVAGDFFEWARREAAAKPKVRRTWGLIVTNPPFAGGGSHLWADWVRHCLLLLHPQGLLFVLGHGLMFTSEKRIEFWTSMRASFYAWHVSPRRPSFSGDSATDGRLWGWYEFRRPGPWSIGAPHLRLLEGVWP